MGDVNKSVSNELNRRQIASGSGVQYPLDVTNPLTGEGRYVTFNFVKFTRRSSESKEIEKEDYTIHLPMPSQLVNTDNLTYEDFDGGSQSSVLNLLKGNGNFLDVVGEVLARSGAGLAGNVVTSLESQQSGRAFNPRKSTVFQSSALKEYSFEFKMVARNKAESDAIRKITDIFRYKSYPNVGNGFRYETPEIVRIKFNPGEYLFEPNDCVIIGMSVSYNGDNTPTFFKDSNAPVEVTLSLQFKEIGTENKKSLEKKGRGV